MADHIFKTWNRSNKISIHGALLALAALVVLTAATQSSCSKKVKVIVEDTGPVRIVVLPFSVSSVKAGEAKDLQWAAMAAPALLAKASRRLPDIEVVPFWEMMPVAISSAGAVRSFTDESAATLANWVSAQWTIMGEIRKTGTSSYSVVVDFIPAKSTTVPFRYIKTRRMENIGTNFYLGLRQWLRYVTGKQILLLPIREPGLQKMRSLGEALDKEYGWLVTAEPGNAQHAIDEMFMEDEDWTKLMFSPTMYPSLAKLPQREAD